MMVKLADPRPGERVCDPAAGTCGFLVGAYQYVLETNTRPDNLSRPTSRRFLDASKKQSPP
jgi:type I restriction enzyme M protein